MVVPNVRVVRRYRDETRAVIFTQADSPEEASVIVWGLRELLEPDDDLILVLPPSTCAVEIQELLDAGYTVRLDHPIAPEEK